MSNYPITEKFLMDVADSHLSEDTWTERAREAFYELGISTLIIGDERIDATESIVRIMAAYTVKKGT